MLKSDRKKILIILIAGIGDVVLASKSFRAVRNGWSCAEIHLLTSTEGAAIARHYEYLDRVWDFPIREMRSKKTHLSDMLRTALALRKQAFDICLNLYWIGSGIGAVKMGLLFSIINARNKIGQNDKGFGLFLTHKAPAQIFKGRHLADAMTDVACLAGGLPDEQGIEAFWDQQSEVKWGHLFSNDMNSGNRIKIGLNPGGDRQNRRWPPDCYAEVANRLIASKDAQVILLGGPGEEAISESIESKITNEVINLAGLLSLNELTYVISKLDLMITNDSGPMHIAAAVKTPLVGIFGPENADFLCPYTNSNLFRIITKDVDCRPCSKNECLQPVCLDRIRPEAVAEQSEELLDSVRI